MSILSTYLFRNCDVCNFVSDLAGNVTKIGVPMTNATVSRFPNGSGSLKVDSIPEGDRFNSVGRIPTVAERDTPTLKASNRP